MTSTYNTTYRGNPGVLYLSNDSSHIVWDSASKKLYHNSINIALSSISNLQQTPITSTKISLKIITCPEFDGKVSTYVFSFTSNFAREDMIAVVKSITGAFRISDHTIKLCKSLNTRKPKPVSQMSKHVSSAWNLLNNIALQRSLLQSNIWLESRFNDFIHCYPKPSLKKQYLYQFWIPRIELLFAHAVENQQSRGHDNLLLNIKPRENYGIQTYEMSAKSIQNLLNQYPIVRFAFEKLAPSLTESGFWTRFFNSNLFRLLKGEAFCKDTNADPELDGFMENCKFSLNNSIERIISDNYPIPWVDMIYPSTIAKNLREGNCHKDFGAFNFASYELLKAHYRNCSKNNISGINRMPLYPTYSVGQSKENLTRPTESSVLPLNSYITKQGYFPGQWLQHATECHSVTLLSNIKFPTDVLCHSESVCYFHGAVAEFHSRQICQFIYKPQIQDGVPRLFNRDASNIFEYIKKRGSHVSEPHHNNQHFTPDQLLSEKLTTPEFKLSVSTKNLICDSLKQAWLVLLGDNCLAWDSMISMANLLRVLIRKLTSFVAAYNSIKELIPTSDLMLASNKKSIFGNMVSFDRRFLINFKILNYLRHCIVFICKITHELRLRFSFRYS